MRALPRLSLILSILVYAVKYADPKSDNTLPMITRCKGRGCGSACLERLLSSASSTEVRRYKSW